MRSSFLASTKSTHGAAAALRRCGMASGFGMEPLEARQLLANIVWDGGPAGTGTDFNLPANWVGDVLPGPADTAVINTAGATITLAAARSVTAVQSSRALQIDSGGNLTTTGANQMTASVTLLSGTLSGGAWDFSGAGNRLVLTSSGGTLNNVTLNQDLVLDATSANVLVQGTTTFPAARLTANATALYFAPGFVLNTLISVEGAAAGGRTIVMAYGGTGTFTVGPTGVIRVATGAGGDLSLNNSSAATLVNNGLISLEAAGRTLTIQNSTFANNGITQATAGNLTLSPANWTNSGTVSGTAATVSLGGTSWSNASTMNVSSGTLTTSGAWSTTGTLTVTNSTFNIGGTFTTTGFNFPGFTRSAGTVNLTGVLTNTGATLSMNAATGSWNLLAGTVIGGTLNFAGGQVLQMTSSGGTLNNVTMNQELVLDTNSASVLIQGTTTFPTARMTGSSTGLYFAPGFVLNTLISIEGAASGARTIVMAYGGTGTFTVAAAGVIRVASGAGGDLAMNNSSAATLVNNGLISLEAAGRTLTIQNSTLTNNTILQATAGNLTLSPTNWTNSGTVSGSGATLSLGGTSWSNASTITVSGGTLTTSGSWSTTGTLTISNTTFNAGGAFSTSGFNFPGFSRTGGIVNLTGILTNAALTLNTATGSWNLLGGSIIGGSLTFANGQSLVTTSSGGTLNNLTINQDLMLDASSANVLIQGSTTFPAARMTGNATGLYFAPGFVLNTLISVEGAAAGGRSITMAYGGTGTFTIGATGVIRVASGAGGDLAMNNSSAATLVNNGLISNEAAGRTLTIQNSTFTNNATTQATAGTLTLSPTNWSNSGTISASSATLNFQSNWSDAGLVSITNSTLTLGGTFATSGFNLAGFTRTGGTVNLSGILTNTGFTLTLNAATGSWNLLGGSIVGGTLAFANGQSLVFTSSGGTLNNVTVNQELILDATSANVLVQGTTTFPAARLTGNATGLYCGPGFVLNTLISVEGPTVGARSITMAYGGSGTFTVGATGVIRVAAGTGGDLSMSNSSVSTLINNGLISNEAAGRTLTIQNSVLTNNGTLQAAAGTLTLAATNWSNPGTISANNATLSFQSNWSDAGTVSITNSTLILGGAFATSGFNLAGLTRTGGTVNLTGVLTNTGSTLTLNAATGTWNLLGGTILGGTLAFANGQSLVFTSSGGTLNNLTMNQDLMLDATSANVLIQGTTTFPAARLTANATGLYFAPGFVLNTLISVEGAAVGGRSIIMAYGGTGTFTVGPAGVIRLASGSGGDLSISNSSVATLVNNGTITAEATGRILTFQNSVVTNNGTLRTTAGTLVINATNWTNLGTITGTGGTVSLGGTFDVSGGIGTFATASVRVQVTGTIPNTGSVIALTATSGSWYMAGGTITGGTISFAGGTSLRGSNSAGTLNNVIVSGDLLLDSTGAYMVLQGSTTFVRARLAASSASLYFAPGATLSGPVLVEGADTGVRGLIFGYGGPATVTILPATPIRILVGAGGGLNIQQSSPVTLINNGLVSSEAAGALVQFLTGSFTNNGTIRTQNGGSVQVTYTGWTNAGLLDLQNGAMTVSGAGAFTDTGVINLGPGGLLTVNSTDGLILSSSTIVNATIGGTAPDQYGRIVVNSGNASLAGTLNILIAQSYQPPIVSTFDFVTVVPTNRSIVSAFASIVMPPPGVDGKNFMYNDSRHIKFAYSSLADFNSDTIVDFFDYLDFVQAFSTNDPAADFNNDTTIDFFDYLDFLQIFSRF